MLLNIGMQTWKMRDDFYHVYNPIIRIDGNISVTYE